MALQSKRLYGATTTLHAIASTAAVATDAMSAESAALQTADHGDYPLGEFELAVTYSVAPTASKSIDLYFRAYDIAGTSKAPAPSTTYKQKRLGSFYPDAVTSLQYLKVDGVELRKDGTYYLYNNATGQSMPATAWGLKVRAYGYGS